MKVNHSFPIFIDSNSKILILGSFPSVKSREEDFYYMHKQNRFYKILSNLFNEDFYNVDINTKKELLSKYHIALYDVIESCEIENSNDETIKNVEPSNIKEYIKNTNIKHIFINGNKAKELFIKYNNDLINMTTFLPSTSARNARFNLEKLTNEYKVIKEYLK
jgi:hypoxanthine-DNA glycosylase